jgi:D-glycero-D-manno-heptose 1,7-bisphosphate phosphatase
MNEPAVFLDRDGTLVHPCHYPSRPEGLVLYDGLGRGLRLIQSIGFKLVVITNQSGLAHGYFGTSDLARMHIHLVAELARLGVWIDGIYYCPHHPEGRVTEFAIRCDCRKPRPGMLLRAAAELDIDLEWSWFVGDILDDVEAGNRAGCRTVLVDHSTEPPPQQLLRQPHFVARDTPHALEIIAAVEGYGLPTSLDYWPESWIESYARER